MQEYPVTTSYGGELATREWSEADKHGIDSEIREVAAGLTEQKLSEAAANMAGYQPSSGPTYVMIAF
jgi:hypothetical protein